MKRVLMIAYHFPPLHGSSGIQRTLKFSQYLPDFGWQPIVLTADPRAYSSVSQDQMRELSGGLLIERAFALDTAKHLAWRGAYPRLLALPDRWVSWWLGAVPAGLRLIRKHRPQIIWSTYPIATAHLVAATLHLFTGIPWVADFRDPMTDKAYPENLTQRRVYRRIERHAVRNCVRAVCTTPGTVRMYESRFPEVPASRFSLICNGYDEENFAFAGNLEKSKPRGSQTVLLHSGVLYPSERDPKPFFAALSELLRSAAITPDKLKIVLRATGYDAYLTKLVDEFAIAKLIELAPAVGYHTALSEMLSADALIVLQASNCNHQIPAKLYEYFRAQRPILALTDPAGDTAATVNDAGGGVVVPLDSKQAILRELPRFLQMVREGKAPIATREKVVQYSRRARTEELGKLFDRCLNRG
ncbi:MAG: glycosyltransferase [Burkholderiales bacterium]